MTETMEYNGYTIVRENGGFFVLFEQSGRLYHKTLEEAKKFIDYINENRHLWIC